MNDQKVSPAKKLTSLEITQAYAEYKTRREGDLDNDLSNWTYNIQRLIKSRKGKK